MPDDEPVIQTEWGPVTPWARKQAVLNMRRDPKKLKEMIARFGEDRLRRDFPEVFEDAAEDSPDA
jgi:hypothetical protein